MPSRRWLVKLHGRTALRGQPSVMRCPVSRIYILSSQRMRRPGRSLFILASAARLLPPLGGAIVFGPAPNSSFIADPADRVEQNLPLSLTFLTPGRIFPWPELREFFLLRAVNGPNGRRSPSSDGNPCQPEARRRASAISAR